MYLELTSIKIKYSFKFSFSHRLFVLSQNQRAFIYFSIVILTNLNRHLEEVVKV